MRRPFAQSEIRNMIFLLSFSIMGLNMYAQSSHNVTVEDFAFTPSTVTIEAGDEVIWTNTAGNHNVNGTTAAYPENPESFGNEIGSGWTYSHTFTIPGEYDYHCDPHVGLGMTGKVIVEAVSSKLTLNLSGMNPHIGQEIYFALIETASSTIVDRKSMTVSESFTVEFEGLTSGTGYHVDFFADHNENGYYDAPPADHAWRLEIASATVDEVINFGHNTDFTDIAWKHRLRIQFSGMSPHIGQMLSLFIRDQSSDAIVETIVIDQIEGADFDIESYAIEVDASYDVDFYADHNGNGIYDAPPTDHAWRLSVLDIQGDTDVDFSHNTDFTDINVSGATAIYAGIEKMGLRAYPNPVTSDLTVESESIIKSIRIIALTGETVNRQSELNSYVQTISLDGMPVGYYILEVGIENSSNVLFRIMKK